MADAAPGAPAQITLTFPDGANRKIDAGNRADATAYAIHHGLA